MVVVGGLAGIVDAHGEAEAIAKFVKSRLLLALDAKRRRDKPSTPDFDGRFPELRHSPGSYFMPKEAIGAAMVKMR